MYKQLQAIYKRTTDIIPKTFGGLFPNLRIMLFLFTVMFPAVLCFLAIPAQGEPMVFERIAEGGFWKDNDLLEHDPHNTRAFSMAWFPSGEEGKLYVGTGRDIFNLRYFSSRPMPLFDPWPIELDTNGDGQIDESDISWNDYNGNGEFDEGEGLDTRAQIWRYTPESEKWERVYRSPWGEEGILGSGQMGRDYGYRSMTVFTEPDGTEALYIGSAIPTGEGAVILRTVTGDSQEDFEIISTWQNFEGLGSGQLSAIRSMVEFKGKLYTTPIGYNAIGTVYESVHRTGGPPTSWRPVSLKGFGVDANTDLYEMAVFNGFLYVGTLNHAEGYQIWKSKCDPNYLDPNNEELYEWTKVITDGAYRGPLNEVVLSMRVFKGTDGVEHLYVGGAIEGGGYDPVFDIGPGAPELIRIIPSAGVAVSNFPSDSDTFELICGEARVNPVTGDDIFPISSMGPGFNNPFAGYFWWMDEYDGWLYIGTFDSSVFLWYIPPEEFKDPEFGEKMKDPELRDYIVGNAGGFDIWKTDGEKWLPVNWTGFENPFNAGVRRLLSTPIGLVVGVANEFSDAPVPEGGTQIWVGVPGEIAKPTDLLVNPEANRIKLRWTPSEGAVQYLVIKLNQEDGPDDFVPELVGVTRENFIIDTNVEQGGYYGYYVLADTGVGLSELSEDNLGDYAGAHAEDMFMFTLGNLTFDRATRQFVQTVSITNYKAPLKSVPVVLEGLTPNVTLANQEGIDESGSPFVYSPNVPADGKPVRFTLKFNNPTFAPIKYVPFVVYRSIGE